MTEKALLPIFSLVLGTKRCLETDDLRVLEISEKCSRLTMCVGCFLYISGGNRVKVKHPSECTILEVVFKIVLGHAPDQHSVASCIRACSAHPTTSPIILLGGNPAEDEKLYSIKDNHMYDV